MTTTDLIADYHNGNVHVTLAADGTKILEYEDSPRLEWPLSVDICVTKQCDRHCPYCHERAEPGGEHASPDWMRAAVAGLPAGTELALGGGNPFAHPNFVSMLGSLSQHGLVCNVTIHAAHLQEFGDRLRMLRHRRWLWGLGVSWSDDHADDYREIADSNTVIHLIIGVHDPSVLHRIPRQAKILLLGYKRYGRGAAYYSQAIAVNITAWQLAWPDIIQRTVAFDNLALDQLGVRGRVPPETWESGYMGDDGTLTMYVDAVRQQWALSSTSPRHEMYDSTIAKVWNEAVLRLKPWI